MKRKADNFLKHWYDKKNRKPLVLRGARQVGKSTLVQNFCRENQITLIEINFEIIKLNSVEKNDVIDLEKIVEEIEFKFQQKINKDTLIFFDEIQASPKMLNVLRYFYEFKKSIPVIASGSLLEFALEKNNYSMPVGRIEFYHLGPMSFTEFLVALGVEHLQLSSDNKLLDYQLEELNHYLLKYFFIGGMPEAIKVYLESKNFEEVRQVHRSIIQTYKNDFSKYVKTNQLIRIEEVFNILPQLYGKKLIYTEISKIHQAREIKAVIDLLYKARVIHKCYHTNPKSRPMSAFLNPEVYKLYFLDVGLLNYMNQSSMTEIMEYNEQSLNTKGLIAEQFVAQHLAYLDQGLEEPTLYYWLRDGKGNQAEVDFLILKDEMICPVEVKSGKAGSMKSLFQMAKENQTKRAYRFDLLPRIIKEKVSHKIDNETASLELFSAHLSQVDRIGLI